MKTKEFIKRVEGLEFEAENGKEYYFIKDIDGDVIASINKLITFQICTDFNAWDELCDDLKKKLFDIISKYTSTPIDEREEEEKYFYEHRFIKTIGGNPTYLAIRQSPNYKYPILQGSYKDIFEYKVEFTDKEMEEAKNKYWICLDDFVKKSIIEVEI